ncbi:RHS repeat-associated protein [Paracidovorax anthurii]
MGDPVIPATGENFQEQVDYVDPQGAGLDFVRIYRSHWALGPGRSNHGLGAQWSHNHAIELKVASGAATVLFGDGLERSFSQGASGAWTPREPGDAMTQANGGWTVKYAADDSVLKFDSAGKILSRQFRNGWVISYGYQNGRLMTIRNHFGKAINIERNDDGSIKNISNPNGLRTYYTYAGGSLESVSLDGRYTKRFTYENAQLPLLLTAIIDENGRRFASFAYDDAGRTLKAAHAGDALAHEFDYSAIGAGRALVKDAQGKNREFGFSYQNGALAITGASAVPALAYAPVTRRTQNAAGLITTEEDFAGRKNVYVWDEGRQLPTLATHAAGTADERSVQTEWHASFRLPVKRREANRATEYTYDALGNLIGERVYDAVQPGGASRAVTRSWEYSGGLLLSATDANGFKTTYNYPNPPDPRPTEVTNALGQTTSYFRQEGYLYLMGLPNGVRYEFETGADPRRFVTQVATAGLYWNYEYNAIGKLSRKSEPSGYAVDYAYDDAHRLSGWKDNRGAWGRHAYDGFNNVVLTEIGDAAGTIAWREQKQYNALNQLETVQAGDSRDRYAYGPNGELAAQTNALNQSTTFQRNAFGQATKITDPSGKSASLAYDGLGVVKAATDFTGVATTYANDLRGNPTRESTADAGGTDIQYDAMGRAVQWTDALARTTRATRDALGRTTRLLFADGRQSVLRYDLAGAAYNADGAPQASTGALSELQDPGVTTRYRYDRLGRVMAKTQILTGGDTRSVGYEYVPGGSAGAGEIAAMAYPGGKRLQRQYDATGQLTGLQWNGQPLLTGITWSPLGQPTGWTWAASGLKEQRSYTVAGQLASSRLLPQLTWDSAGRLTQLQQRHMLPAASGTAAQQAVLASAFTYDAAGRLTASAHSLPAGLALPRGWGLGDTVGATASGYAWDANGNRTQAFHTSATGAGTARLERVYQPVAGSNRLKGYSETFTPAGAAARTTQITYAQDATGALTKKGDAYLHYGADGRIAKVGLNADPKNALAVEYTTNALGQRVFKRDARISGTNASAAVTVQTVYAEDGIGSTVLGQYGNRRSGNSAAPAGEMDSTEIIYLPTASGPMPVAAQINGRLYAIDADHLNTPRRLTNAQGQVVWQWLITGFGEANPTTGATGYAQSGEASGRSYGEAVRFDLRYPGQVWDEETGLSYNLHRYYDAGTGRYIQADPIGLDGGWNRFVYVNANPLLKIDPVGLCPLCLIPALPYVGEVAVIAGAWWASQNIYQEKTPNRGKPWEWHTNPGSGQERLYGPDGRPTVDIDWDHDHGQGQPHPHNWGGPQGPREVPENGFSPWPRGRKNPAGCN